MIRSLPRSRRYNLIFSVYIGLFYFYLFAPLLVTVVLAFNDSMFPALPWNGFALDWFFSPGPDRVGFFHDSMLLESLGTSVHVGLLVAIGSVVVGTAVAFLFEYENFPFKEGLYFLMLAPLVIPGVILGISILSASNSLGLFLEEALGWESEILQPGFSLVVIGQFSFIATLTTLIILARLRKFDHTLEEAALNLGASRLTIFWRITLPYLRPALIGAGVIAFLMSFENFNTTLFLIGPEPTFPITLYLQVRDGSTPVINAASFILMLGTGVFALANLFFSRREKG